jgi:hypothetical protein
MKYTVLSAILISFLLSSIFSFAVGIYAKDFIFLTLGFFLAFASLIIFLEVKGSKNDPFF